MFSVCHHPVVPASESLAVQQIKREIQRKTVMGAMIRLVLRPLVGVMETAEENPASLHRTAFPHGLPARPSRTAFPHGLPARPSRTATVVGLF
jgi:hypothetical protein